MAKIVLGMASSHAPQLEMPPNRWRDYGDLGRKQPQHWFHGKTYSFEELADLRAENHFDQECTDEKFQRRWDDCQKAIAHLAETLARVKPDVCVILGDDQHEAFLDENMPALSIYYGATVDDAPQAGEHRMRWGDPVVANAPRGRVSHPTDATLGEYLIEALIDEEFDVARTNKLPEGRRDGTIGHAFYYVYRRLMDNKVIPNVPILVNTYYPPNAPKATRCYKFGQALREAIEAWEGDQRVAVIASGGLSHTVIEEDLDKQIIAGLRDNDVQKLTDHADVRFRGGTSEIKNWIILAGAMAGDGLQMNLVDYVPCYRTEAGNGCAMGFAEWL
jgi:hypothetical protein